MARRTWGSEKEEHMHCGSCGADNLRRGEVCWLCGSQLRSPGEPAVNREPTMALLTGDGAEQPPPRTRFAVVDRTLLAGLAGGAAGLVAAFLLQIPFLVLVRVRLVPLIQAVPYLSAVLVAGLVTGVVAGVARSIRGVIAGYVTYAIMAVVPLIFGFTVVPKLAQIALVDTAVSRLSGLPISWAGFFAAFAALRAAGVPEPIPHNASNGRPMLITAIYTSAVILLLLSWFYGCAIYKAVDDPRTVVAAYCRTVSSDPRDAATSVRNLVTADFQEQIEIDPRTCGLVGRRFPVPSVATLNRIGMGVTGTDVVRRDPSDSIASVSVVVDADGRIPEDWGFANGLLSSQAITRVAVMTFPLRREDGGWRVSGPPKVE